MGSYLVHPVVRSVLRSCVHKVLNYPLSWLPPYNDDIYPIADGEGICGKNNSGGKRVVFNGTTTAIDQVGTRDETQQNDYCYTIGSGDTGEIVLDTPISYSKYIISSWLDKENTTIFHNGATKTTFVDGTQSAQTADTTPLTSIDLAVGDNYIITVFDLSTNSAAEVDTYMAANTCLFFAENFDQVSYDFHVYGCDNKTGTNALDSGTATKNDGVTELNSSVTDINYTTIYHENIRNLHNRFGYNLAAYFNETSSKIDYSTHILIEDGDGFEYTEINEVAEGSDGISFSDYSHSLLSYIGIHYSGSKTLKIVARNIANTSSITKYFVFTNDIRNVVTQYHISVSGQIITVVANGESKVQDYGENIYLEISTSGNRIKT